MKPTPSSLPRIGAALWWLVVICTVIASTVHWLPLLLANVGLISQNNVPKIYPVQPSLPLEVYAWYAVSRVFVGRLGPHLGLPPQGPWPSWSFALFLLGIIFGAFATILVSFIRDLTTMLTVWAASMTIFAVAMAYLIRP